MTTLAEFLLARIADLDALARAVMADQCSTTGEQEISTGDDPWPSERLFAEHFTPARVLAECEAKRYIVSQHDPCGHWTGGNSCDELTALASIYADHPDWCEEWRV